MKRKVNKISMMVVATVMFLGAMFLSMEKDAEGNWQVATANALASGGESGGNGQQYHRDDFQPCTITEFYDCTTSLPIYIFGVYIGTCSIGFSIPYDVQGTQNDCEYTGNPQNFCNSFTCKKNGT